MSLGHLDVVFLAWRERPEALARQHAAVAAALPPGWSGSAVLVENAAPPATSRAAREALRRAYPAARRVVLRMPRNAGFARAMDVALVECRGRHAVLVNADGEPGPDMFAALSAALDARPGALWAAPAIHGAGEPGHPPGPPYPQAELSGMALAIRREAFLALGGFDPLFFFYNEDFDASRRIRATGGELLRVPEVVFRHDREGRSARGRLIREFWFGATHQALAVRHAARPGREVARLAATRAHALGEHARARDLPGLAGIAGAAALLPATTALALRRRRAPWDEARLRAWLSRTLPGVERIEL